MSMEAALEPPPIKASDKVRTSRLTFANVVSVPLYRTLSMDLWLVANS